MNDSSRKSIAAGMGVTAIILAIFASVAFFIDISITKHEIQKATGEVAESVFYPKNASNSDNSLVLKVRSESGSTYVIEITDLSDDVYITTLMLNSMIKVGCKIEFPTTYGSEENIFNEKDGFKVGKLYSTQITLCKENSSPPPTNLPTPPTKIGGFIIPYFVFLS